MTITITRKLLVVVGGTAAVAAAGTAIAAWSTSGSGDAAAKAATASALTLADASASTSGDLYPGGSGALKLKISNPNSFPVRVTAVQLTSGGTITSSSAACNTAGHGVTLTAQTGLAVDLAANASNQVVSLAGAVQMSSTSGNACQGVVLTIPVDVTAASQ